MEAEAGSGVEGGASEPPMRTPGEGSIDFIRLLYAEDKMGPTRPFIAMPCVALFLSKAPCKRGIGFPQQPAAAFRERDERGEGGLQSNLAARCMNNGALAGGSDCIRHSFNANYGSG